MSASPSRACCAGLLLLACTGFASQSHAQSARSVDVSGVMFANFQYRTDAAAKAQAGGKPSSRFDIERVYLTFRAAAGERASFRVTTDVFQGDQSGESYYRGWTARLKYAYLQYQLSDALFGLEGVSARLRAGMLQTVEIEHEESFWPRYIANVAVDRNGFFSSADLGAAIGVSLPSGRGEAYAVVTNGDGYTSAETDRFKDVAVRLSLSPFAASHRDQLLGSFTVTGWAYTGRKGSRFATGGAGQVGPVSDGLRRDRVGAFVGVRDPRLAAGVSLARRVDGAESGDNTAGSPRTVRDVAGRLSSVFAVVRPGAWRTAAGQRSARWGIIGRLDAFTPDDESDARTDFSVASLFWEVTPAIAISVDRQVQTPRSGSAATRITAWYLRMQGLFGGS